MSNNKYMKQRIALQRQNLNTTKTDRIKIIFGKTTNCISIMTYSRELKRKGNFLIAKEEIRKSLYDTGYIVTNDINSFAEIRIHNNHILFEISWLDICLTTKEIQGHKQSFQIDQIQFENWFKFSSTTLKILNQLDNTTGTIKFCDQERLKEVISNKTLRKKFGKIIMTFQRYKHTNVYNDFVPYSFSFRSLYHNDSSVNGGIICHKDNNQPTNYSKYKYGLHT